MRLLFSINLIYGLLSLFSFGAPSSLQANPIPGETPLWFLAAESGDVDTLTRLRANIDIDAATGNGLTALMLSAAEGHIQALEWLAAQDANLDLKDARGFTALLHALSAQQWLGAGRLLKLGAGVDHVTAEGNSALHFAASNAPGSFIRFLISQKAPVNAVNVSFASTPLLEAVQGGNAPAIDALLEGGADVEKTDRFGWSPLRKAAFLGHLEIVKSLIAAGAEINAADADGWTARQFAASRNHHQILAAIDGAQR